MTQEIILMIRDRKLIMCNDKYQKLQFIVQYKREGKKGPDRRWEYLDKRLIKYYRPIISPTATKDKTFRKKVVFDYICRLDLVSLVLLTFLFTYTRNKQNYFFLLLHCYSDNSNCKSILLTVYI